MNEYFISLLQAMKTNELDRDSFVPDKYNWGLAQLWYNRYSSTEAETLSDVELLDLLYFFYIHENLEFYSKSDITQVADLVYKRYGIEKDNLLAMFSDFNKLVYGF